MSTQQRARFVPMRGIAAVALLFPASAVAQQPANSRAVQDILEISRERYAIPPAEALQRAGCGLTETGEIVVCAPLEDPDTVRIGSSLESGDDSHLGKDIRAPDVPGSYVFKGKATAGGLCVFGPCPKPPVFIVDFASLPEAPEGSDAAAIAAGEKPSP